MKNKKMKGGIKNMNKILLGVIALSIIAILGVSLSSAFGLGLGKANLGNISDQDKAKLIEKRDAIEAAIEANDYAAWKELMNSEISETKFNQIVSQHNEMSQVRELREELRAALESGDESKASEIKAELSALGFEQGLGKGNGMGRGMHSQSNKGNGNFENCPFAD